VKQSGLTICATLYFSVTLCAGRPLNEGNRIRIWHSIRYGQLLESEQGLIVGVKVNTGVRISRRGIGVLYVSLSHSWCFCRPVIFVVWCGVSSCSVFMYSLWAVDRERCLKVGVELLSSRVIPFGREALRSMPWSSIPFNGGSLEAMSPQCRSRAKLQPPNDLDVYIAFQNTPNLKQS